MPSSVAAVRPPSGDLGAEMSDPVKSDALTIPAPAIVSATDTSSGDRRTLRNSSSRTASFLTTAFNLRPRGGSVGTLVSPEDDWARPVGGSDGLGTIYGATMNRRERNQVMRSVTTLAKLGTDDQQGNPAEPLPTAVAVAAENALPPRASMSAAIPSRTARSHSDSPPDYHQSAQPATQRTGSEGSIDALYGSTRAPAADRAASARPLLNGTATDNEDPATASSKAPEHTSAATTNGASPRDSIDAARRPSLGDRLSTIFGKAPEGGSYALKLDPPAARGDRSQQSRSASFVATCKPAIAAASTAAVGTPPTSGSRLASTSMQRPLLPVRSSSIISPGVDEMHSTRLAASLDGAASNSSSGGTHLVDAADEATIVGDRRRNGGGDNNGASQPRADDEGERLSSVDLDGGGDGEQRLAETAVDGGGSSSRRAGNRIQPSQQEDPHFWRRTGAEAAAPEAATAIDAGEQLQQERAQTAERADAAAAAAAAQAPPASLPLTRPPTEGPAESSGEVAPPQPAAAPASSSLLPQSHLAAPAAGRSSSPPPPPPSSSQPPSSLSLSPESAADRAPTSSLQAESTAGASQRNAAAVTLSPTSPPASTTQNEAARPASVQPPPGSHKGRAGDFDGHTDDHNSTPTGPSVAARPDASVDLTQQDNSTTTGPLSPHGRAAAITSAAGVAESPLESSRNSSLESSSDCIGSPVASEGSTSASSLFTVAESGRPSISNLASDSVDVDPSSAPAKSQGQTLTAPPAPSSTAATSSTTPAAIVGSGAADRTGVRTSLPSGHNFTSNAGYGTTRSATRVSFDIPAWTDPFAKSASVRSTLPSQMEEGSAAGQIATVGGTKEFGQLDAFGRGASMSSAGSDNRRSSFNWSRVGGLFAGSGSRRGSGQDSLTVEPTPASNKSRSFGRGGAPSPSLRDSMKRWASRSTDVLTPPSASNASSSGSLAAVDSAQVTPARKSLHLPRRTAPGAPGANDGNEQLETLADSRLSPSFFSRSRRVSAAKMSPSPSSNRPRSSFSLGRPSSDMSSRPSFNFLRRTSESLSSSKAPSNVAEARQRKPSASTVARDLVKKTFGRSTKVEQWQEEPRTHPDEHQASVTPMDGQNAQMLLATAFGQPFKTNMQTETLPTSAPLGQPDSKQARNPSASTTFNDDIAPDATPTSPESKALVSGSGDNAETRETAATGNATDEAPSTVQGTPAMQPARLPESGLGVSGEEATGLTSAFRRPSLGIDQEQDDLDASRASSTVALALEGDTAGSGTPSVPPLTEIRDGTASRDSQSTSSGSSRRANRNNRTLSHLPRLDSMRASNGNGSTNGRGSGSGGAGGHGGSGGSDGNGGSGGQGNRAPDDITDEEQEATDDEDEDEDDIEEQSDTADFDETETETDNDNDGDGPATADGSFRSARSSAAPSPMPLAVPMSAQSSSGGSGRNRPSESIVLPPAPTFIPAAMPHVEQTIPVKNGEDPLNSEFKANKGRDSWTSFNSTTFSPFETPTPGFSAAGAYPTRTPRARHQEVSESSYFTHRPSTANRNNQGTMSGVAPPPSPSIISRSRAPSTTSMRTVRGSAVPSTPSIPGREVPQLPLGSLAGLNLTRETSTASGKRAQATPAVSETPQVQGQQVQARPSTSSTLRPPRWETGSEAARSRDTSLDRPASERGDTASAAASRASSKAPAAPTVPRPAVNVAGGAGGRPGLYQHKSKSLIDLSGAYRRMEDSGVPAYDAGSVAGYLAGGKGGRSVEPEAGSTAPRADNDSGSGLTAPSQASLNAGGVGAGLGRRRSMFEMRQEPPPYSIIHRRPEGPQIILPREEEGREKLPQYYCGVHIEGYLPRKMEFSAPGLQAKDRSWKRQYFVLHGTSLRVYRHDLSSERFAASGAWGEMKGVHVHLEPMNEDGSTGGASSISQAAREAIAHKAFGHHNSASSSTGASEFDVRNGLVRHYTLQGAESGLAADYLKRRHVVRVRAEGEQFLLQTRSDRHVVDWIEALQAATNVSMDLEKRPMPKFITLPRRRRRRRRNPDGTTVTAEEQEARDLAEAQRRSMMETGGRRAAAAGGEGGDSAIRSARPSMSGDMNPSAAFEEMLREEEEGMSRSNAADI